MKEDFLDYFEEFRKELREHPRKIEIVKFLGKMLLIGLIFRIFLYLDPDTYILQKQLADLTGIFLNFLGYDFSVEGLTVVGLRDAYLITRDCLGWKSVAVFAALIISTPDLEDRLWKILLGSLLILSLNLMRVLTTVILAEEGVMSFDLIHTFLWRWGMTFAVILLWYYWISEEPLIREYL